MVEVKFEAKTRSCLETVLQEAGTGEQIQEIKLPDGMPDVGQVISAWGQPILRGKEWRGDSLAFTGGMMVWVLYQAEDGSGLRCIDAWVPFQMKWELPSGTEEGKLRLRCMTRFVDARSVSPRKLMVRCGMAVLADAMAESVLTFYEVQEGAGGIELLKVTYPVRLPVEMGEKTFSLDENVVLPESMPQSEKILYCRLDTKITDKKVLSGKLVFRGAGMLHILYTTETGKVSSWDFEVPFSQYAELEQEHSTDAQADIQMAVTNLEVELGDGGSFRVRCALVAQYLITDKVLLEMIEDAYCPGRDLELDRRIQELQVVLENRRETVCGEQGLAIGTAELADSCMLMDFPRQMRSDIGVDLEFTGTFHTLYYDEEGALRSATSRWDGNLSIPADENSDLAVVPGAGQIQASTGSQGITLKAEIPMEVTVMADQGFFMVTGVELGEESKLDPGRPSLILRRAGTKRLWDIAKDSGSTMAAIQQANNFQGEPVPGQMLLIPVP